MITVRRLVGLLAALIGGVLGNALSSSLFAMEALEAQNDDTRTASVSATSVTLIDKQGKKRLMLGMLGIEDAGVRLSFLDQNENRIMSVSAGDDFALLLMDTTHTDNGGAEASIAIAEGMCGTYLISHRFKSEVRITANSTGAASACIARWGEPDAISEAWATQTARVEGGGLVVTAPARQGNPTNGGRVQLGYSPHSKQMDLRVIDDKGKILWNAP